VNVNRYTDRDDFARRVIPLLLTREAENNFFLGLLSQPQRYPGIVLCAVEEGDDVIAIATMTPPWHMVISRAPDAAAQRLAEFLTEQKIPVPGVQGDATTVETFAARWMRLHDEVRRRDGKGLGIYQLDRVIAPAGVSGTCRPATEADLELLLQWREAFIRDIGEPARDDGRDETMRSIEQGRKFLWCDPDPVCMVSVAGPTPNGIRVNAVYTPPQHRRRGYGSAATAAVSQRMLEGGRKFCFLYTDLANPTSNKIYRDIGYQHVCDQVQVFFDPPTTA
jgi:predicted GNAT family acetyltransferase